MIPQIEHLPELIIPTNGSGLKLFGQFESIRHCCYVHHSLSFYLSQLHQHSGNYHPLGDFGRLQLTVSLPTPLVLLCRLVNLH